MRKILLLLLASFTLAPVLSYAGKGLTLYVDAGHGGADAGAVAADGVKESELCLELARMIADKGGKREVKVVLIRSNDEYIKLTDRIAKSNDAQKGALFISLHLEASENRDDHGAKLILGTNNQIDGTQQFFRAMMHNFGKMGPVKAEKKPAQVLKQSRIPAMIVSPGYITNPADLAKLKTKAYQEQVAETILSAVLSLE